jgi:hypothetical protein
MAGAKKKYKVSIRGMFIRVADSDREEIKKIEKKFLEKHLIKKIK